MNDILKKIYDGIIEGDRATVREQVTEAISAGLAPGEILNQGMIEAMTKVGCLFEEGEYFVPEMLVSARAMQEGLAILKPHLVEANVSAAGRVVIGTVKGDLHDIGKNLVAMMLEGAGFEVFDLGTDVAPERFVEVARDKEADVVAMSALLTTTMPNMRVTIEALEAAGLRDRVKVMVGGAPLTDGYAVLIKADGYSPDASKAVTLARTLVAR